MRLKKHPYIVDNLMHHINCAKKSHHVMFVLEIKREHGNQAEHFTHKIKSSRGKGD